MNTYRFLLRHLALSAAIGCALSVLAQTPGNPPPREGELAGGGFPPPGEWPEFDGPTPLGPGGFGRGGPGPGGFGGMMQQEVPLVKQFDKDGDQRLNAAERKASREYLSRQRGNRGPGGRGGRWGGPGGFGESSGEAKAGVKISPAEVKSFPEAPLYAPDVLRTFFIAFESADWEKELEAFHGTDVEVPAKLTVDGRTYSEVGVHFRGMSSYMMVGEGHKRSLNLSLDFVHPDQRLAGYRTLNLLNSHEDPTFLRTVLYYDVAREYIPAPKANLARVVINGENWGVYVNVQQFNKDFAKDWFGTTKGARWKVPGSPGGQGSLAYLGDDAKAYKRTYEIKSKDDPKSWSDLIRLCRVLNETATDRLESALQPLLDIDGALKFLALENALVNSDGYWVRSSDYNIYQDEKGRFHLIPHDANETFSTGGGPGGPGGPGGFRGRGGRLGGPGEADLNAIWPQPDFARRGGGFGGAGGGRGPGGRGIGGGPGGGGVQLDPLVAANDSSKPLLSKLLAVPSLRTRYLGYVRDIADQWLDWKKLGPRAKQYQALIADDLKADTRKLSSFEAFQSGVDGDIQMENFRGPGRGGSLKSFAEQRRKFLLEYKEARLARQ